MPFRKIYQLALQISNAGLKKAKAPINRKGILFINRMSMVNTLSMLAFSVAVVFLELSDVLIFTLPFAFLFALPPYFNHRAWFYFSRYYFSVLPLLFLLIVCIHNGAVMGDKYLILTSAAIPVILFKNKKDIFMLFFLNIAVFFCILWYQSNFEPIVQVPLYVQHLYFVLSHLTLFMAIFFIILYFRSVSENYEAELEEKNRVISHKNTEMIDSIQYAKRLQEAILPPVSEIKDLIPDSFILYKPKDIVAGDFYFAEQKGDYFFVAAADCTGHGVPGALVSIVCSNALKRAVLEFNLTRPGLILDKVTELVVETFRRSQQDVKDGMDVSLCSINLKTKEISWAGANNPLWYVGNNQLHEIKATKQAVGKNDRYQPFVTHSMRLPKGSLIYLFSDGYADQFGGPQGKKFKYRQLSALLISIHKLPMEEQRTELDQVFEQWRGDNEQVDDLCIIGIRI